MIRRPIAVAVVCLLGAATLSGCSSAAQPTPQIIFVTAPPTLPTPQIIYVTPSPGPATPVPSAPSTAPSPSTAPPTATLPLPPSPSPSPSSTPAPTPTLPPAPTPTAQPTPTPTPPPTPKPTPFVPTTTFKIVKLPLLDRSNTDPLNVRKDISFSSDGLGDVILKLSGITPGVPVQVCFAIGITPEKCRVTTGITLTGHTLSQKTTWHVRLAGASDTNVTSVDVAITFPAKAPRITVKDFYLSGGSASGTGIVVDITSRASCNAGFLVTPDDPSVPLTVELKDVSQPGSTAPAPGPGCVAPPSTLAPQGTIAGHAYELTASTTSTDQHNATLDLSWP